MLNIEPEDVKQSIRLFKKQQPEICTYGIFNLKCGMKELRQTQDSIE